MSLDLVNSHVLKAVLVIDDGDSINAISKKAGGSYGWTHRWIERLEEIGVVDRDDGVRIRDSEFREAYRRIAETVFARGVDLEDAYLLPNFSGMDYRFSRTDAVYVWTAGGYQIGRDRRDYPIYLDVLTEDRAEWEAFFDRFSMDAVVGERRAEGTGIYYVLFPTDGFESERVESATVTPLEETVEWARQYEANFQPALEMLEEMYDHDLGIDYRERNVMGE